MSYAIKNDGKSWRAINDITEIEVDEVFSEDQPTISANIEALHQMLTLEASITPRRMREAILGDGGWLADTNAKLADLRKSL